MSKESHSQEPWHVDKCKFSDSVIILDKDYEKLIATVNSSPEDARRICACVNALAGLATETIERNAVREAMGATTLILQEVLRICRLGSCERQEEALDKIQPMLEELLSGL